MNNRVLVLFLCFICALTFTSCSKNSITKTDKSNIKYVDIYDVVHEAFLTNDGYTDKLSKHMSKDVFNSITYTKHHYPPQYSKPFKVDFTLKEISQTKENDLVYVDMIYSRIIKDANGKDVSGSWNVPIRFTVKSTANDWYIINKYEKP